MAPLAIDFACNNPNNGIFAGNAMMATYGDIEIEAPSWRGYAFTEGQDFIRIHRCKFATRGSKEWIGNWCWNRYWLDRPEMKRLLLTLRKNGWRVTCGPTRFYDWFNGENTNG